MKEGNPTKNNYLKRQTKELQAELLYQNDLKKEERL